MSAGNSPTLVKYLRVVLRIALNAALKSDRIARNAAELATPPNSEKREVSPFTPEQAGRFLNAAVGHRIEALFTVGLAVGPMWTWTPGRVAVRHTLQRVKQPGEKKGHLMLLPPKSEELRRTIELPATCVAGLRTHKQRQEQERALAGSRRRALNSHR
jgi:integrase